MMSPGALGIRLAKNDVRLILRDPLLVLLSAVALGLGCVGRFVLPWIDQSLEASQIMPSESSALRFSDTYPIWVVFIGLWQAALMPGTVFAFLLLDEKEDDTLTAMRVTPVPTSSYLLYRLVAPTVMAFGFALSILPLIGFAPVPAYARVVLAFGASLVAPCTTLILATFAQDKVQGLALVKFFGIAGLTLIIGWFVSAPWQTSFYLFPPFLIAKGYWLAADGESAWWAPALVGTLLLGLVLRLAFRAFLRSVGAGSSPSS